MIAHVIDSAKKSGVFDKIYVNSDSDVFEKIASSYDVEFYLRPPKLGSSETKSDEVVYDFIRSHPCDTLVWVNPVSPLQPASEISDAVTHFTESDFGSLITVSEQQVHCLCGDEPVNFSNDGLFAKTQDLTPVKPFAYSLMMWDAETFVNQFEEMGYAMFCGETSYYPVSDASALKVKNASDLLLIDAIARGRASRSEDSVQYHEYVNELNR